MRKIKEMIGMKTLIGNLHRHFHLGHQVRNKGSMIRKSVGMKREGRLQTLRTPMRLLSGFLISSFILCASSITVRAQIGEGRAVVDSSEPSTHKKVMACLALVRSGKDDLEKYQKFFSERAKKQHRNSNYAFGLKAAFQISGFFLAGWLESQKDPNASWKAAGFSGGLPLSIQLIETYWGKWQTKSNTYELMAVETGKLIRSIEVESFYIENFAPEDTVKAWKLVTKTYDEWNSIIAKRPESLTKEDVPGVKQLVPMMRPPILPTEF